MSIRSFLVTLIFVSSITILHAGHDLPTGFFENKGQVVDPQGNAQPQLHYLLPLPGMNVQLHNCGFSYETFEAAREIKGNERHPEITETRNLHRVDVLFPGANTNPQIIAEEPLAARYHYYTTGTPAQGVTGVRQFRKITYKNLYPSIDLELQVGDAEKPFEYNFIVHPGGNPSSIRLQYSGALSSKLENGNVVLELAHGTLEENIPHSFIRESGETVQVHYRKLRGDTYGLQVSPYTSGQTLVIDPVPVRKWATYFGGASSENAYGMDVGPAGDVFITGNSQSSNNIATFGAFQSTVNFLGDAYIAHFNSDGTLDWATYFGNSGRDVGEEIAIDGNGDVVMVGYTESSSGLATTGSHQATYRGNQDGLMVKFNAIGNRLWCTYFGGFDEDDIRDVAIGPNSTIYIAGTTQSLNYISTSGTHQPSMSGTNEDAFLAKFDASGNQIYGTYYGSISTEWGNAVAVDSAGNAYFAGWTTSSNNLATSGTHQSINSGGGEAFLGKFDNTGNRVWATYFGGPAREQAFDVALDNQGYIYMSGETQSTSGVATVGTHQVTYGGAQGYFGDAYAAKFFPNGTLVWATYYGGNDSEDGEGISVDDQGNVYMAGLTESPNNIASPAALYSSFGGGGFDGYIVVFDSMGQRTWGSYYGSAGSDVVWAIKATYNGVFYVAGSGQSFGNNEFATVGAHQGSSGGFADAVLARFGTGGVGGRVFFDLDEDCVEDSMEWGLSGKVLEFQPGPYYASTTESGDYGLDLPPGTYTVQVDTTPYWRPICPVNPATQTFTVVHADSLIDSLDFALTGPLCTDPQISIVSGNVRPCFSNNQFYIQACNGGNATGQLDSAYAILDFGPNLFPLASTLPLIPQPDSTYRVDLGNILPGDCVPFSVTCSLSCAFPVRQTVCVEGNLFPADSCALDSTPNPPIGSCTGAWDKSHLVVEGSCDGDSLVRFAIYNFGGNPGGNMACFREYRLFSNNQFVLKDSFQLVGGDSLILFFPANGSTFRLETDQHPLHPGNPHPSTFVEACGDSASVAANWIPGIVNQWPLDDADPVTDILCVQTSASYDPNDKTGFPLGITSDHLIEANTDLEYRIRFQNTGTDTAFTVLIRDRLPANLDINSVISGASSHPYTFRIFGDRMLEWRYDNILLPDSNTNEPASNGVVSFKVKQVPNLPDGTLIFNQAAIYFDYNAPIITNFARHKIGDTLSEYCTLNATIDVQGSTLFAEQAGDAYQWIDCSTGQPIAGATDSSYIVTANGDYAVVISVDLCEPDTSACETVTLVGVSEVGVGASVYPNPAEGQVAIRLDQEVSQFSVSIIGLDGKQVARLDFPQGGSQFVMPLNGFASGIYLLKLDDGDRTQFVRLAILNEGR